MIAKQSKGKKSLVMSQEIAEFDVDSIDPD